MRLLRATLWMTMLGPATAQVNPPPPHHQVRPAPPAGRIVSAEPRVSIAPYWVHLDSESGLLAWRTKRATSGTLTWTDLEDGTQATLEFASAQQHSAHLTGLQPEHDYRWELTGGRSGTFTTLPASPERRFAILGHTHGSEHFGAYSDHLLVNQVAASEPHFVVHCGDAVYHSTVQDWARDFFAVFRPIHRNAPVYIAPGNHDSGWPFVDGLDLRPFKQLFAYPYAPEAQHGPENAFYDLVQGPLHLFFLSYVSPLGPGSAQRSWLQTSVANSSADFKVVVLGGFDLYYDKASLHEFLATLELDAVFQGDGTAPAAALSTPAGFPIFTVGSANQNPDPWLNASVRPEYLIVREMDAAGAAKKVHWIHAKTQRKPLHRFDAEGAEANRQQDRKGIAWTFELQEPLASKDLHGLQFQIEGLGPDMAYYYGSATPSDAWVDADLGYRSQYGLLEAKDRFGSCTLPRERPLRGGEYLVHKVDLRIVTARDPAKIRLLGAWLY